MCIRVIYLRDNYFYIFILSTYLFLMFKILTGTGKKILGRPRSRWDDNIRMDLKEIGINTRNLVDSTQDGDYW